MAAGHTATFAPRVLVRGSERDVVYLGWPIYDKPIMCDRVERQREDSGVAGYHWLSTAVRMEPNY
jgi:hypothetical protein